MAEPMDVDAALREHDVLSDPQAHAPAACHAVKTPPLAHAGSIAKDVVNNENQGDTSDEPPLDTTTNLHSAYNQTEAQHQSTKSKNNDGIAAETSSVPCRSCGRGDGGDVRVCTGCQVAVHASCYGDAEACLQQATLAQAKQQQVSSTTEDGEGVENTAAATVEWQCDCCVHAIASPQDLRCVFCEQLGREHLMKVIMDTHNWQHNEAAAQSATRFAHLLCSRWDPRSLYAVYSGGSAQSTTIEEEPRDAEAKTTTTETADKNTAPESTSSTDAPAELAIQEYDFALDVPGPCCFCASSCGVRIKCQHLDCGLFFHIMCAYERNGYVEIRSPQSPLAQYHAYCARHRESSAAFDASALLEKLLSKPIGALTGRDVTLKFQTIRRRLEPPSDSNKSPFYMSINAFFSAVATVLVDLCKKGMRGSKADPPVPNLRHLQALQFFLDHVPQLQIVYRAPREPVQRLVLQADGDSELVALLQKTFNPQKYFGKYAGPVSQVHVCHVCSEAFHERQHLFYCSHETTPHLQHWKCTKRRSNSREREKIAVAAVAAISGGGASKKAASSSANNSSISSIGSKKKLKSISLVVNGQWREVMLPKGLPGVSDEIICGVCRSDVDAHGLIGSRKEGKRADFEKKKSNFVHGGRFGNPVDGLRPSGAVSRLAGSAAARPPIAPVKVETTKASSKDRSRGSKRSASTMESSKSSNVTAAAALEVSSAVAVPVAPVLGPPKMERINVQRTTKWLACVAQIIRLAGTVAKLSSGAGAVSSSSAAVTTEAIEDVVKEEDSGADQEKRPSDTTLFDATTAELALMRAEDRVQHDGKPSDDANSVTTDTPTEIQGVNEPPRKPDVQSEIGRLSQAIDAYFDEAIQIVRPFDAYVLSRLETARGYLRNRNGPAVGVLRMIAQEYTRFVYVKHTRAVEKASNEKRKREEQAVQELRDQERKRLEREAELALRSQMLAMRKKQRKLVKTS